MTQNSIRTLIVAGGNYHDFDRWYGRIDAKALEAGGLAVITYTNDVGAIAMHLPDTDVIYFANNQAISDPAVRNAIFDFVNSGHGLVLGHAALWYNWSDWPEFNLRLVGGGARNHDKYGRFTVKTARTDHPVIRGIQSFTVEDERYHYEASLYGAGIEVLASATVENSDKNYPSIFVLKDPKHRIVGIALGHDGGSHQVAQYQQILRQAIQWAAHR